MAGLVLSGTLLAGAVIPATAAHGSPGFHENCTPNVGTSTGGCGSGGSNLNSGGGGFGGGFAITPSGDHGSF